MPVSEVQVSEVQNISLVSSDRGILSPLNELSLEHGDEKKKVPPELIDPPAQASESCITKESSLAGHHMCTSDCAVSRPVRLVGGSGGDVLELSSYAESKAGSGEKGCCNTIYFGSSGLTSNRTPPISQWDPAHHLSQCDWVFLLHELCATAAQACRSTHSAAT